MKRRIISESIIENERLIRCGFFPTMLFQRLIMIADDCGRCPAIPEALKTRTFPNDEEFSTSEIGRSLEALAREGLILLYEVRGRRYLCLTGWNEHQKLRFYHPEYPAPEEGSILETDELIYNNTISIFEEEAKAKAKAKAKAQAKAENEKDQSLSLTPPSPPSPSLAEAKDADTTSGEALGRGCEEKENNDRFERFWRAYPRKIKKHEARRVFLALRVNDGLLSQMVEQIGRQRKLEQWIRESGRYIPSPAQWLRGRRWEDEPPDVAEKDGGSFDTDDFFLAAVSKKFETRRRD